jgi:hypothetical protein
LDLDQEFPAADVDDETLEWHLEFVVGPGVVVLEGGVQRPFVEGADMRGRRDARSITPLGERRERRTGLGEQVALQEIAPEVCQRGALVLRLDAFGDH